MSHCLFRIGLIEWMENTCTLKEFLYSTMTDVEQQRAGRYSACSAFICNNLDISPLSSDEVVELSTSLEILLNLLCYKREIIVSIILSF